MGIVYVTRHGQTGDTEKYPPGDVGLSALGRKQALLLGERLKEAGFNGDIHSSPFRRTVETADIICGVLGNVFLLEAAMSEIFLKLWDISRFRGLTLKALREEFSRLSPSARLARNWWPRGEETDEDVYRRVGRMLESRVKNLSRPILLVGHGASSGAAVKWLAPDGTDCNFYNCALSAAAPSRRGKALLANDTAHLGRGEITMNREVIA